MNAQSKKEDLSSTPQQPLQFLYTSDRQMKSVMRKTTPLIIAARNMNCVHTNSVRNVKDSFEKNSTLTEKQYLTSFFIKKT